MQVLLRQRYAAVARSAKSETTEVTGSDEHADQQAQSEPQPTYSILSSYITVLYLKDTEFNDGKTMTLLLEDGRFDLEAK